MVAGRGKIRSIVQTAFSTLRSVLFVLAALPLAAAAAAPPSPEIEPLERRIVAAVEDGVPDALALLEETVNVNSGTLNAEGVREVGAMFRAELDALGFSTRWIDGEPFGRGGHLVAEHRPSGPSGAPRILLIGHLDTVFEPDSPFQRFERLDETTARGPGVNDMKGGNVVIVLALSALAESGALDRADLTVILTGDEESVGHPRELARQALVEAADAADVALGFEDGDALPTTAVIARRGSTSWRLSTTGSPAHSSQIFRADVGYGAIFEAARVLDGFRERLAGEEYLTFNPGTIVGGTSVEVDAATSRGTAFGKTNVVAERAEVRGDLRTLTPEQLEAAKAAMREVAVASLPGTGSEIAFDDAYPPMPPTEGNRRLLALLDRVSRDLGHGPVAPVDPGAAGAADISFAAPRVAMAIDGLGLLGPGDHTVEETADLSTLPVQAARAAVLIHRLSEGVEDGRLRSATPGVLPSLLAAGAVAATEPPAPPATPPTLSALVEEALAVEISTHSAEEYRAAAETYRSVLDRLAEIDREALSYDERIDADLLERHAETRLFEIEELRLHEVVPVRYYALFATDGLFLRPCSASDRAVEAAIEELERLPEVLANARENLTRPARVWTENAIYQARYARELLAERVPEACVGDPELAADLAAAAGPALEAVDAYEIWLREVLLPRSDRSPAWTPEEVERYQFVHEGLTDHGVDEMLRMAEEEETRLLAEMRELARRIHPSGDLRTVWELMKDETPPWDEVLPMARWYVEHAAAWLAGPGAHVVAVPESLDYGAIETTPMARRLLSFGGAEYGPTVGGRISGYYVVTPIEEGLAPEEAASRLRSYNPYWTHVISYHEWLGHNVQRAHALANRSTPMRAAYRGQYLSQAWSFYLEKLLEDEGYYDTLPHMEALKTRMARRQMRMWRVQRILTKLRMAKGEMTFDQAVEAYVETIGMEPANAFIEVQRDSQSPAPPGREIVGEWVILDLREEYRRRMGEHFRLRSFHEALLAHGELPLPVIAALMLGDEP